MTVFDVRAPFVYEMLVLARPRGQQESDVLRDLIDLRDDKGPSLELRLPWLQRGRPGRRQLRDDQPVQAHLPVDRVEDRDAAQDGNSRGREITRVEALQLEHGNHGTLGTQPSVVHLVGVKVRAGFA